MGIGKKIAKIGSKLNPLSKIPVTGKMFSAVDRAGERLANWTDKHVVDKVGESIFPTPEVPDMSKMKTAQATQEGELEGASITLGSKRKRMNLAKPAAPQAASGVPAPASSVGLRI